MKLRQLALPLISSFVFGCAPAGDERSAREILTDLSPVEQLALEDRVVTFGEYDSAVQLARDCLRQLGAEVDPSSIGSDGLLQFGYTVDYATDERLQAFESQAMTCFELYDAVEVVYSFQNASSQQERDEAVAEFRRCVSRLGVDSGGEPGAVIDRLYAAGYAGTVDIDAGRRCLDIIAAVSVAPVPGIAEALDDLDLGGG